MAALFVEDEVASEKDEEENETLNNLIDRIFHSTILTKQASRGKFLSLIFKFGNVVKISVWNVFFQKRKLDCWLINLTRLI